jgi:hypothetical protein
VVHSSGSIRRFKRYKVEVPCVAHVKRPYGNASLSGQTLTFGEGGVGAAIKGEQLSPGDVVNLFMRLPQCALTIQPRATVRYSQGDIHGFEFVNLSALQLTAIRICCGRLDALAMCC